MDLNTDFKIIRDNDTLIYDSESEFIYSTYANVVEDYRTKNYEGIKKAYMHSHSKMYDITFEIFKDMGYDKAKEIIDAEKEKYDKKQMEKIMHKNFVYKDFGEMMEDLNKIKPCNLSSNETSFASAQKMFEKILTSFVKAEDLTLTAENQEWISNKLESLRGCKEKQISEKFFPNLESAKSVDEIICKGNSIEYPFLVVSNLISLKGNDFTAYFNYLTDGGLKESPCGKWLKAQENAKIKNGIEK